jgi:hypothetical protein
LLYLNLKINIEDGNMYSNKNVKHGGTMAGGTEGLGAPDNIRNLERQYVDVPERREEPPAVRKGIGEHFKTLKNKVKASSFLTGVGVALLTLGAIAGGASLATPIGWTLLVGGVCVSAYFAITAKKCGVSGKDVAKEVVKNIGLGFLSPGLAVFAIYNAIHSEFGLGYNIPKASLPDFPDPGDEFVAEDLQTRPEA